MKIYRTDQTGDLARHLKRLQQLPVLPYDERRLPEKEAAIPIHRAGPLQEADRAVLFRYRIFPPTILKALGQWDVEGRDMQAGDTIVQQILLPPVRRFSLKLIMGVRVSTIIREPGRAGFCYETLEGHVERGRSTFLLEQAADGLLQFRIHTFSEPATMLLRTLGPALALPYQAFCTRQALRYVRSWLTRRAAPASYI